MKIKIFTYIIFLILTFNCYSQSETKNIIWITCEDISPYIGTYGDRVVKTPNIDKLAQEGILLPMPILRLVYARLADHP